MHTYEGLSEDLVRYSLVDSSLRIAIFFLIFMIPLPSFLVDSLTDALKLHVSSVSEQILYLLDDPVARNGVTIPWANTSSWLGTTVSACPPLVCSTYTV